MRTTACSGLLRMALKVASRLKDGFFLKNRAFNGEKKMGNIKKSKKESVRTLISIKLERLNKEELAKSAN